MYTIDLYRTEEGIPIKIENALWKKEYNTEEALELITTILYHKFSDEITGIIINNKDDSVELPTD